MLVQSASVTKTHDESIRTHAPEGTQFAAPGVGALFTFVLPLLVIFGLFTRIASVGMIAFIAVQTYVDITVHQVGAKTIGAMFDRFSDGLIADQRLLWIFPLVYLAIRGAGAISVDRLLTGMRARSTPTAAGIAAT